MHRRGDSSEVEVFRKGSTTFFNASLFFPPAARHDVIRLYAFVRTADDFVDSVPQRPEEFADFARVWRDAAAGRPTGNEVVENFAALARRRAFEPAWVDAFLRSMEDDLHKTRYESIEETLGYVYGSAEVIGLFMARILELPTEADEGSRMLGRAMQFINFIRDIDEDNRLGRQYLPASETRLPDLRRETAEADPAEFRRFVGLQVERYRNFQREAERGYRFLPRRYLVPIKTAADMYLWTGDRIAGDPFLVFRRKVKPPKWRIIAQGLVNMQRGSRWE